MSSANAAGSVVGPEDHRGSLAFGNRVEAVVVACRGDRGDADLVAVQGEIDVNRIALGGDSEGLLETEARVERDGARDVLAEENDLRRTEPRHGATYVRLGVSSGLWQTASSLNP